MTRRSCIVVLSCAALLACTSEDGPVDSQQLMAGSGGAPADGGFSPSESSASGGGTGGGATSPDSSVTLRDGSGQVVTSACKATRGAATQLPGSRDPAVLARAAAVVGSCMPDDGIDRNLANMWHADVNNTLIWDRLVLQAECLANANCGCDAIKTCIGWEITRTEGDAGADAGACTACAGSVYTLCGTKGDSKGLHLTMDCSAIGQACDPLAACSNAPAEACMAASFTPTCAAERPAICLSKFEGSAVTVGPDCSKLGLTCTGGQCVGTGEACTGGHPGPEEQLSPQGLGCSGTMLDACIGGKHHSIDCKERGPGFSCQSSGGAFFCGLASECLPGNEPQGTANHSTTCEGNTVVFCNAGRIDRVDCLSLGFSGCNVDKAKDQYGCIPGASY